MITVLKWRKTGKLDYWGEEEYEGYAEGYGWCIYSWRLGAIKVNGKWTTNWRNQG